MNNYPTREGVDDADALTFPDIRRITISTTVSYRGRQLVISSEGYTADEFCDLLDRRFGSTPAAQTDAPMCPVHHKAMRQGKGGWYCPTKLNDDTWCRERAK